MPALFAVQYENRACSKDVLEILFGKTSQGSTIERELAVISREVQRCAMFLGAIAATIGDAEGMNMLANRTPPEAAESATEQSAPDSTPPGTPDAS